jgi:hypothetical protein
LANDFKELKLTIRFFLEMLEKKTQFELVQSLMNVFLKVLLYQLHVNGIIIGTYVCCCADSRGNDRCGAVSSKVSSRTVAEAAGRLVAPAVHVSSVHMPYFVRFRHSELRG